MRLRNLYLILIISFMASSCAFFQTPDSGNYYKIINVENPLIKMKLEPWTTVQSEGSDFTLFNNLTKSYYIFNSACRKNELSTLKTLTSSMFSGIEQLQYLEKTTTQHQGREAALVTASGKVDGVTRYFKVLTTQKNNCIYDYVLIAINENTLQKDTADFNSFSQSIILK